MKKQILLSCLALLLVFAFPAMSVDNKTNGQTYVLRIAGDNNHPPYEYVDTNGNYKGFNVDIMRAIAIELGIEIELIPMEWNEALRALEENKVDAIQGMSKTNAREKLFTFTSSTINNSQAIFVLKNTNFISEIEDLPGARVSFQNGDVSQELIKNTSGIVMVPKSDQESAMNALLDGKADAFIGNRYTGLYYLQKQKKADLIKIVGEPLCEVQYGPAVLKENFYVAELINQGIDRINKNGIYDKIYKKWFGENLISPSYILQMYKQEIILVFSIITLIIVSFISWNKKLKSEVLKRTSELEEANKDLIEQQEEIHSLAHYDTITGLPNRLYFVKTLENAIISSKKDNTVLAILNLDLDRFKQINDTLGHDIGDNVLQLTGERISEVIKEKDFLARVGGDEFFVLVKDIDPINGRAEVIKTAEAIINNFEAPYKIKNYELFLTTSIGISMYPKGGIDFQGLMKTSDLAMYKAKENGGNKYYIYDEALGEKQLENLILINKLRQAEKNKELELYYQPKVETDTEKIIGMEALLRWNHSERGMIYPNEFIPIAEETGLIVPIGEWVLWNACKQAKEWQEKGYGQLCISVNISARQFQNQNIIDIVSNILKETGLEPRYLELEITETIAMLDINYTIDILKKLKNIGVSISIDDFGTGYSSLNYLKQMNVDELKIDKSFIKDLLINPKNMAIAKTIILLAHQLNLQVTAEGVETEEDVDFLRENRCDKIQGYYYSAPIAASEFEEHLMQNQYD